MKLLIIGPRQTEGDEAAARQLLQSSAVESYIVCTPHRDESNIAAMRRIWREGIRVECDTVSAQDPLWSGILAYSIARRKGVRFNVQVHTDLSTYSFLKRIIAKFVLRRAHSIRVVSEKIKSQVHALGATSSITVLPVYIEVSKFTRITRCLTESVKKILWVGRFEAEKDPMLAIEVLKKVRQTIPNVRMVMLGSGTFAQKLSDAAANLPLEVPGWADPSVYLASADVVLNTSPAESFGVSIVEALAAGVPVVSQDVGVAREYGAVVVPKDRLADAVVEVLQNPPVVSLRIPLYTKDEWVKKWRESL